jgi:hypothetical protein
LASLAGLDPYVDYKVTYFDSIFYEDILKYQLWEALKELKIWTFNDEGGEKIMLQNEEVLA